MLVAHAGTDAWRELDEAYLRGEVGSRTELEQFVDLLPTDPAPALATAAAQAHDETFAAFVAIARDVGARVEVVSDGWGFYVEPALEALGVRGVTVTTARTSWESGRPQISFPNGHPDCFVCGTCKRQRVLWHKARGRHTVMVGDGPSDRFGAAHADTIFAKSLLAAICDDVGWTYRRWERFSEIGAWLRDASAGGTIAAPADRSFICGPEIWGPGRTDPPRP